MDHKTSFVSDLSGDHLSTEQKSLVSYLRSSAVSTFSEYVQTIISLPNINIKQLPQASEDISEDSQADLIARFMEVLALLRKNEKREQNYYTKCTAKLSNFIQEVTASLQHVLPDIFVTRNSEQLSWLCVNQKELIQCLSEAQTLKQGALYGICLLLTAILDRSLQDIIWTIDSKTPVILKDLLQNSTLVKIIGDDILVFLDIIVGPPTSLNIRNLVWHGFGSVNEHPEHYAFLIFFTFIIIGQRLGDKNVKVSHRSFVTLDTSALKQENPTLFEWKHDVPFSHFVDVIGIKSIEIAAAVHYASSGRFGLASALLLTSFEHISRAAFCISNSCSQRLMTAVSSEYFTTLDHVFSEKLSDERKSNALYHYLPQRLRSALYDLLYYPCGLRLRDRLSHMEILFTDVSEDVWSYCYNIVSTTILFIVYGKSFTPVANTLTNNYVPQYHPLACAALVLDALKDQVLVLSNLHPPAGLEFIIADDERSEIAGQRLLSHFDQFMQSPLEVADLLFCTHTGSLIILSTSSGFQLVAEWCTLLHAICDCLLVAVKTMCRYGENRSVMFNERNLRARQRKNFLTFHSCRKALAHIYRMLHLIMVQLFNSMANTNSCVVKKKHKSLLQLSENLSTFAKENKWAKSIDYFIDFVTVHYHELS